MLDCMGWLYPDRKTHEIIAQDYITYLPLLFLDDFLILYWNTFEDIQKLSIKEEEAMEDDSLKQEENLTAEFGQMTGTRLGTRNCKTTWITYWSRMLRRSRRRNWQKKIESKESEKEGTAPLQVLSILN
ncbi:hypothetical protein MKW98_024617 [Papaver atlanticum]|uniref:Uncharacterized protein n=1 Tax=Papaver atlanticum TaxID=357466 RepID=A0AAD4X6G1_9MAGN|nr:hypothetical protein MKW98_024617 [Papaver atlanticum]